MHLDRGAALYALSRFEEAGKEFLRATEGQDPALKATAFHNLGNALFKPEKHKEAVEAYKRALALQPRRQGAPSGTWRSRCKKKKEEEKKKKDDKDKNKDDKKDDKDKRQRQEGRQGQDDKDDKKDKDKDKKDQQDKQDKKDKKDKDKKEKQPQPEKAEQNQPERIQQMLKNLEASPKGSREGAGPPARDSPRPRRGTGRVANRRKVPLAVLALALVAALASNAAGRRKARLPSPRRSIGSRSRPISRSSTA